MNTYSTREKSIKKNLDTVIFEKLKDEIIAGRWEQGQQLLIDDLVELFGVSRTPVIQAVRMMAVEGLFNLRPNGRIEIPTYSVDQIRDVWHVRLLLEEFALKTICENKSVLEIQKLKDIARECAAMQTVHHDAIASRRSDLKLHRSIVESSGNECLLRSYVQVQGQFTVANYLLVSHTETQQSQASDEHFDILRSLEEYDYPLARQQLEQHIMGGCERVLARLAN